jgi:hypothetical protein
MEPVPPNFEEVDEGQPSWPALRRTCNTSMAFHLKRLMRDLLGYGLALEDPGVAAETPTDTTGRQPRR